MSLLPDSASFHERVQDCFVAYRGRGVSLSAVDVELVEAWATSGAPFEVIARGIRKAAEAAMWDAPDGAGLLRSLAACRRSVDSEIAKYLKRTAGRTESAGELPEDAFHVVRHKKLVAAVKKLAKEQPGLERALVRTHALPQPHDFAASNAQEELVLAWLLRALPFAERRMILREARRLMENAAAVSAQARRESLRFHRAALVRQKWSLPSFW